MRLYFVPRGKHMKQVQSSAAGFLLALILLVAASAQAAPIGFLETLHSDTILTNTIPGNGDQKPYSLAVAPISAGHIKQGDVLIGHFNDSENLFGTGSTIVDYRPDTQQTSLFATIPADLKDCPGGVGLSTAMTILKSGWVIVGSTPSNDGSIGQKGAGCLIVLDSAGKVASTIVSPEINDPWGNLAVVDNGEHATLFVSNAGFGVDPATTLDGLVLTRATVLRLDLEIAPGKPPIVSHETVIGRGFAAKADRIQFLVGPAGLAISADRKALYVSDAVGNRITRIDDPMTRDTSAGTGQKLTANGLLHRPLAIATASNGHLLVTNGLNGQVVEIDPVAGKQLYARWIDIDKAQSPPGNGDLFAIVLTPAKDGIYYLQDDVNSLSLAR
jgi:hypothetical protein